MPKVIYSMLLQQRKIYVEKETWKVDSLRAFGIVGLYFMFSLFHIFWVIAKVPLAVVCIDAVSTAGAGVSMTTVSL